jgi:hypothetical protein
MIRFLGMCVAVLGIASLVLGIVFMVMAGSAKSEIIDDVAEEAFPIIVYDEDAYPYLNLSETETGIIDTEEEIDALVNACSDARHKMSGEAEGAELFMGFFAPSTIPAVEPYVEVDTLIFHEYCSVLGLQGLLGMSQMGLGMTSLLQIVGIISIIFGVALMLIGLIVFKLAPVRE